MMAIRLVTEAYILHSMVAMGSEKNKLHCGRLLFLPSHHIRCKSLSAQLEMKYTRVENCSQGKFCEAVTVIRAEIISWREDKLN
jgi:hypothetical protein